jgi:hypothetical protein
LSSSSTSSSPAGCRTSSRDQRNARINGRRNDLRKSACSRTRSVDRTVRPSSPERLVVGGGLRSWEGAEAAHPRVVSGPEQPVVGADFYAFAGFAKPHVVELGSGFAAADQDQPGGIGPDAGETQPVVPPSPAGLILVVLDPVSPLVALFDALTYSCGELAVLKVKRMSWALEFDQQPPNAERGLRGDEEVRLELPRWSDAGCNPGSVRDV